MTDADAKVACMHQNAMQDDCDVNGRANIRKLYADQRKNEVPPPGRAELGDDDMITPNDRDSAYKHGNWRVPSSATTLHLTSEFHASSRSNDFDRDVPPIVPHMRGQLRKRLPV